MADGTPAPPPAPLPVWQAVVLGYTHIGRHFAVFLTMAALWSFVVMGGLDQLIVAGFGNAPAGNEVTVLTYDLAVAVAWLVGQVGGVIVAIAGYRAVLLGEAPSLHALASFGRRELRYLGVDLVYFALNYMVFLTVYLVLVAAAGAGAAERIDGGVANSLPFDLAVGLLSDLVIAPFLILALPLAALDARHSLFLGAWQLGRGHRLRLCAVSYIAGLPFMLLSYLPRQMADPDAGWLDAYLWTSVAGCLGLLWVAFYSGCIALAFDWIMQRQRDRSLAVFD